MTLQEHLADLQQKLKQVEADYHAINGAIQLCQQLIEEEKAKEGENADS